MLSCTVQIGTRVDWKEISNLLSPNTESNAPTFHTVLIGSLIPGKTLSTDTSPPQLTKSILGLYCCRPVQQRGGSTTKCFFFCRVSQFISVYLNKTSKTGAAPVWSAIVSLHIVSIWFWVPLLVILLWYTISDTSWMVHFYSDDFDGATGVAFLSILLETKLADCSRWIRRKAYPLLRSPHAMKELETESLWRSAWLLLVKVILISNSLVSRAHTAGIHSENDYVKKSRNPQFTFL